MKDFHELKVWHKAHQLTLAIDHGHVPARRIVWADQSNATMQFLDPGESRRGMRKKWRLPNSRISAPSLWDRPPSSSITYCWPRIRSCCFPCFSRNTLRKKDGKSHRYFSVVENRRLPASRTFQRTVLYLGEIDDQQRAAWRKTLEVFEDDEQEYRT
jgi:hypothetical protein